MELCKEALLPPHIHVEYCRWDGRSCHGKAMQDNHINSFVSHADISGKSAFGVAAEHQPLDDIFDIRTLIGGNFAIQTVVTPGLPVVSENLAKAIMTGGKIGMLEGGTQKLICVIVRIYAK